MFLEQNMLNLKLLIKLIDKANTNTAVLWKHFYVLTLMKNLGFKENHRTNRNTYETDVDKTSNQFIIVMLILFQNILTFCLKLKTNAYQQSNGCLNFIKNPAKAKFRNSSQSN